MQKVTEIQHCDLMLQPLKSGPVSDPYQKSKNHVIRFLKSIRTLAKVILSGEPARDTSHITQRLKINVDLGLGVDQQASTSETRPVSCGRSGNNHALALVCSLKRAILFESSFNDYGKLVEQLCCFMNRKRKGEFLLIIVLICQNVIKKKKRKVIVNF